jgi:hypothetical protein
MTCMVSAPAAHQAALEALMSHLPPLTPARVHALEISLAELLRALSPPEATLQLALARRYLAGQATKDELIEAQRDCWTYVGSLACGCSISDAASADAVMVCLSISDDAHGPAALAEQVSRVLRCEIDPEQVLRVLREALSVA